MTSIAVVVKMVNTLCMILKEIDKKENLPYSSIESWRWDNPEARLTWWKDDVWRNITTFVTPPKDPSEKVSGFIEVNAWRDFQEGEGWIREWKNARTSEGIIEPEPWCNCAYNAVSSWDKGMLKEKYKLRLEAAEILNINALSM